jgi:hypothetical protein
MRGAEEESRGWDWALREKEGVEGGPAGGERAVSGAGIPAGAEGRTEIDLTAGGKGGMGDRDRRSGEQKPAFRPVARGGKRGRLGRNPQVGQDAVDDLGIANDGDDLECAGAAGARAPQDSIAVDAPQKVGPRVVGGASFAGWVGQGREVWGRGHLGLGPGNDLRPPAGTGTEHTLVPDERLARRRNEPHEAAQELPRGPRRVGQSKRANW